MLDEGAARSNDPKPVPGSDPLHHESITPRRSGAAALATALDALRPIYRSPAWGDPKGLVRVAGAPDLLTEKHQPELEALRGGLQRALDSLHEAAANREYTPASVAAVIRRAVFSDTFCVSLYVADRCRLGGSEPLLPRFEHAIREILVNGSEAVVRRLEELDCDDQVQWFEGVVRELSDLDDESRQLSEHRIAAVVDYLPNVFQRGHPARHLVEEWLADRTAARKAAEAFATVIETGNAPELSGEVGATKRPAAPIAEVRADPSVKSEPITTAADACAPAPTTRRTKPQVEIPKESLLEGIDGSDKIGDGDTRSAKPIISGNVGRDPNAGRNSEALARLNKAALKRAEQDARMRAKGLKPASDLRLPGERRRDQKKR